MSREKQYYFVITYTAGLGFFVGFLGGYINHHPPDDMLAWLSAFSGWAAAFGALLAAFLTVRAVREQIRHQQKQHTFDNLETQLSEFEAKLLALRSIKDALAAAEDHISDIISSGNNSELAKFQISKRAVCDIYLKSIRVACKDLPIDWRNSFETACELIKGYFDSNPQSEGEATRGASQLNNMLKPFRLSAEREIERLSRIATEKKEAFRTLGADLIRAIND